MIEALLVLAKALRLVGAACLFGACAFERYGGGRVSVLPLWAMAAAWLGHVVLLPVETANMAGVSAAAFDPSMLGAALSTFFGRIWVLQTAMLAALVLAFAVKTTLLVRLFASAVLVAALPLQGHAGAAVVAGDWSPAAVDIAHAFAAAIWIGALAALVQISLGKSEVAGAELVQGLNRFSQVGPAVILVLVVSGLANVWIRLGGAPLTELFRSAYGATLAAKLVLFCLMLALAGVHRYLLAPRLTRTVGELGSLRLSLAVEGATGVAVLCAAALLASTPPPGH